MLEFVESKLGCVVTSTCHVGLIFLENPGQFSSLNLNGKIQYKSLNLKKKNYMKILEMSM